MYREKLEDLIYNDVELVEPFALNELIKNRLEFYLVFWVTNLYITCRVIYPLLL